MKKYNFIKFPLIAINIIISICLIISVHNLNVLPTKYFLLFIGIIVIINILSNLFLCLKKWLFRITGILLSIILIVISVIGITYVKETDNFLETSFNNNKVEIASYNVLVLKDSSYKKIDDLKYKNLGILKFEKDSSVKLSEIVNTVEKEYEDLYDLYDALIGENVDAILLDQAYINVLEDDHSDLNEKIRILYSFDIENEIEEDTKESVEVVRPINIYVSGSDSRSNYLSNKTRSDVNMIISINPNSNEILLTSIPRDYYVQVHGQTGLKDKLTHAGIYGVKVSAQTLEDLFDIEIDYTIKVGMGAVTEVVDLVGGIEVYSDTKFKSYHLPGWVVEKGMNQMDGKKALAYARERYAYASGDRHRIQNQQQVLEAVLKKVLTNKSLLLKYDQLLASFSSLYLTDIPKEVITEFVKEQLNTMEGWTFEKQWVDGKGASLPTHTAPKYKRYVMIPNEQDVSDASAKIKELITKE